MRSAAPAKETERRSAPQPRRRTALSISRHSLGRDSVTTSGGARRRASAAVDAAARVAAAAAAAAGAATAAVAATAWSAAVDSADAVGADKWHARQALVRARQLVVLERLESRRRRRLGR